MNIADLVEVAQNFGQVGENNADINGDGIVNIVDLILVAVALGEGAAAPAARRSAFDAHCRRSGTVAIVSSDVPVFRMCELSGNTLSKWVLPFS